MMSKKVIVFDLDGTLAESKQPLDSEMATLLKQLIDHDHYIAVMSGGSLAQYKKQFLSQLPLSSLQYQKLYLLPTSGTAMYRYTHNDWQEIYMHTLSLVESDEITTMLHEAAFATGNIPEKIHGAQIEDRGSQITFSALGQDAPLQEKSSWDPDRSKRKEIIFYFIKRLPQYTVHIGGTNSIDITKKGIDKTYGIQQLSKVLSIPISDMVFVGDALYPGGNDEPAKASGIECVSVKNIDETKAYIRAMLTK